MFYVNVYTELFEAYTVVAIPIKDYRIFEPAFSPFHTITAAISQLFDDYWAMKQYKPRCQSHQRRVARQPTPW